MLRYLLLSVLILASVLLPKTAVFAQDDNGWRDGCDERAIALIADYITNVDYTGACENFVECTSWNQDQYSLSYDNSCKLRVADVLLQSCYEVDCERYNLLLVTMIDFFGSSRKSRPNDQPPQIVIDLVPEVLRAYQSGDYQSALHTLQAIERETKLGAMAALSQGIVYEALGEPGNALIEYDRAMGLSPDDPLIWYFRTMLLGALGHGDEAAFEAERLVRDFQISFEYDPLNMMLPRLRAVQAKYPLQFDRAEKWLAYPYISGGGGESGLHFRTRNQLDPLPVGLIRSAPTMGLVITGLEDTWFYQRDISVSAAAFIRRLDDGDGYQIYTDPPTSSDFPGHLDVQPLDAEERVFSMRISFGGVDGASYRYLLLVPEGAADPREGIYGLRCGVISRLRPGMRVNFSYRTEDSAIFDMPGGVEIGRASDFTILQEHQCISDTTMWWKARSVEGMVGWIPENDGEWYVLNASDNHGVGELLEYCPGVPTPRLFAGGQGKVNAEPQVNNIRRQPSRESEVVGQMPAGATFNVLYGPTCKEGYAWWRVEYEGVEGWTAEGQGNTYWLEPIYEDEIPAED